MKKCLTIILIIALALFSTILFNPVYAEVNWEVSATTNNDIITEETKQVVIQLKLDKYSGNGELGYQANLSYDKNIFQSVSINAQNDWDDVEYEESTGDFISTTKNAKEGTVIAEIVLTLKDGLTNQSTTVSLNDVVFSDADVETNFSKSFTYTIKYETEKPDTPDDGEQENPSEDNKPNTGDNQEEQTPNTDDSNNTETPNTNNPDNTENSNTENSNTENSNANNTQTPNTNTNTTQTGNTTIIVGGATNEDITTAGGKIPQTGGVSTLVIIGIVSVIGIACYIRYRTIQVK